MARKLRGVAPNGTKYVVHFDRDWREWQVRAYKKRNGVWKFAEGPTYYSNDKEDAVQTFWHIVGHAPAGTHVNPNKTDNFFILTVDKNGKMEVDDFAGWQRQYFQNGDSEKAVIESWEKESGRGRTILKMIKTGGGPNWQKAHAEAYKTLKKYAESLVEKSNPPKSLAPIDKTIITYGMAVVDGQGTIHWTGGGVTHCGKAGIRTAYRTAAEQCMKHAAKIHDYKAVERIAHAMHASGL